MSEIDKAPLKFLKYYTVDKDQVTEQRNYNKQKLEQFGNLGTRLVDPLLVKFLDCEEIAVRWSCEGYPDAPKYRLKIPHLGFLVTDKGLDQLLCYLENCRREIAMNSEYWLVTFHHGSTKDDSLSQMVSWSLTTFLNDTRREFIFKTMCEEFDLYFNKGE